MQFAFGVGLDDARLWSFAESTDGGWFAVRYHVQHDQRRLPAASAVCHVVQFRAVSI